MCMWDGMCACGWDGDGRVEACLDEVREDYLVVIPLPNMADVKKLIC